MNINLYNILKPIVVRIFRYLKHNPYKDGEEFKLARICELKEIPGEKLSSINVIVTDRNNEYLTLGS